MYRPRSFSQMQRVDLVSKLDQVIGELLDGCGGVSGDNGLAVVCDENCLGSFADDDTFPAL
jgi:hypothetical protein